MAKGRWIKHGFWNTLEHTVTRAADALTSLVLIWVLTPELFSKLALSQAVVAPSLLFFLAPEGVMYRDFSRWQQRGEVGLRVRAFRHFGWLKAPIAVGLAAALASLRTGSSTWEFQVACLVWAYAVSLSPQLCGADREYLRISLQLRKLNLVSVYQKGTLLAGTLVFGIFFPNNIFVLTGLAVFSALSTAVLAYSLARGSLETSKSGPGQVSVLIESIRTYSLWTHFSGVVLLWIQTMDLFFLGLFRFPAREVGLYAAVARIANLSSALPMALSNLFAIWIGRKSPDAGQESRYVAQFSVLLLVVNTAQAAALYLLGPLLLELLSHGRWSPQEQTQMLSWMGWLLLGVVIAGSTYLLQTWLWLRTVAHRYLLFTYVPWLIACLALYYWAVPMGTDVSAIAKVGVGLSLVLFQGLFLLFVFKRVKEPKAGL